MRPLNISVKDGKLVFEIDVDTLAVAAQHAFDEEQFNAMGGEVTQSKMTIFDKVEFAKSVAKKMDQEDPNDGSSPLTRLLDKVFINVADDGDESLYYPGW